MVRISSTARRFGGAVVLAMFAALPLTAQQWVVDAAAGSTTHEAVPGSGEALGATFGIRREAPHWIYLAAGLPLGAASLPWAALGTGGRLDRAVSSGFGMGLDVAAHVYGYTDESVNSSGAGATLEALPLLFVQRGATRVELRTGVVHHGRTDDEALASRTLHHTDVRAAVRSGPLRWIGEARYLRAEEGDYPYAGGVVELGLGEATFWASGGRWLADALNDAEWGAGARLGLGRGTALHASFRREANDPLYWSGARTIWSVGASRSVGRVPPPPSSIAPPQVRGTSVTFRIPLSLSAEAPAVGGDFTGWEPVTMRRDGAFWVATVPVTPGLHRYAYRRPGGEWFVPDGTPGTVDDGFGGESATVLVR